MSIRSSGISVWSCYEKLVAVAGAVPQDEQHGGLDEPLEPRANAPAARADPAARAGAAGQHSRAPSWPCI